MSGMKENEFLDWLARAPVGETVCYYVAASGYTLCGDCFPVHHPKQAKLAALRKAVWDAAGFRAEYVMGQKLPVIVSGDRPMVVLTQRRRPDDRATEYLAKKVRA